MVPHQPDQHRLRGRIERRGRFVEQPERPPRHQESRQRDAPALSGREIADRQLRDMRQPDRGQRLARRRARASPSRACAKRDSPAPSAPFSARRDGRRDGSARSAACSPRPSIRKPSRHQAATARTASRAGSTCRPRCGRSARSPRHCRAGSPAPRRSIVRHAGRRDSRRSRTSVGNENGIRLRAFPRHDAEKCAAISERHHAPMQRHAGARARFVHVAGFLELLYRTRGYAARRSGAGLGHSRGGARVMRIRPSIGCSRKGRRFATATP